MYFDDVLAFRFDVYCSVKERLGNVTLIVKDCIKKRERNLRSLTLTLREDHAVLTSLKVIHFLTVIRNLVCITHFRLRCKKRNKSLIL